jgi:hypothetical protein
MGGNLLLDSHFGGPRASVSPFPEKEKKKQKRAVWVEIYYLTVTSVAQERPYRLSLKKKKKKKRAVWVKIKYLTVISVAQETTSTYV